MEELLTDEFVRAFYKKMQSCGYPNADKIGWAMGTNNWANSIRESCLELNLKELLDYYEALPWDDSDKFDFQLYEIILAAYGAQIVGLKVEY